MDREYASPEQLGEQLKQLRENLNLDLNQLSENTKINTIYLQAVEDGRLDVLPPGFYRKIFVREYCEAIGADSLLKAYEQFFENAENEVVKKADDNVRQTEEKNFVQDTQYRPENNKPLVVVSCLAIVVAMLLAFSFKNTLSGAQTSNIAQLNGGTAKVLEQKKLDEAEAQREAEEKMRKQAEKRAEAEEAVYMEEQSSTEPETAETSDPAKADDSTQNPVPAKNELLVKAAEGKIKIKVSQGEKIIYDGEIAEAQTMRFKIEGSIPVHVRYENPDRTEVYFGEAAFKPLHPSREGRSRYYWSDGTVTFTKQKTAKQ